MWNSCTSVFPNTLAWEQQELNDTETDELGKKKDVSMERSQMGRKNRSLDGLSLPNQKTIIIIDIILRHFIRNGKKIQ